MKTKNFSKLGAIIMLVLLFGSCQKEQQNLGDKSLSAKADAENLCIVPVKLFAKGFNNPRGLKFGPDGNLYVAEAGLGGTNYTIDICPELQVSPDGGGPFRGSPTGGRISRVNSRGVRTTVTENLPTVVNNDGSFILGVADVAFIDNRLYALLFAGCSHGVTEFPSGIVRVKPDGTHTVTADIGTWQVAHPVVNRGGDFEPEGDLYSMMIVDNGFYVVEANQGQLLKTTTGGTVRRVVDISASQGHNVPTAIDYYHGNFYVGNLGTFPIVDGSSNIYKITPDGHIDIFAKGFTTIQGLVIDKTGRFYVLENTVTNEFPAPGPGRIIRINHNGSRDVIAKGLSAPTAMTMGPDGNLYVSNWGYGGAAGDGQVMKVILNNHPHP